MDVTHLWEQLTDDERLPLVTLGETRVAVALLQYLGEQCGDVGDIADDLAATLARRLPEGDRRLWSGSRITEARAAERVHAPPVIEQT